MTTKDYMSFEKTWEHGLITGYFTNWFNCLYGTAFPCCAVSSAKSVFDGSDWCFNLACFSCSLPLVRNYIRQGYEIDGRVGLTDCCASLFLFPCVVTQLLNEVTARGRRLEILEDDDQHLWQAPGSHYTCIGDPVDFWLTYLFYPFELMSLYANFAGVPFWFACCPCYTFPCMCSVNICQVQHIIRKSYGISGEDCVTDLIQPTICMLIPGVNCVYFFKVNASLRAEIKHRGPAPNFLHDKRFKEEDAEDNKSS